jgi:hypothetical protein
MRPSTQNQFALEALEPRLLLSADPGFALSQSGPSAIDSQEVVEEFSGVQGEDDGFGMIPGDLEEILIPVPSPATDRAPEVEDKTLADNSVAPESLEAQVTETVVMNGSLDQDDQEESGLSTAGTIDLGSTVADQLVQTLKAANGPPDAVFIADLSANADVATDGNSALDQGGQGVVPVLSGLYFEREVFQAFYQGTESLNSVLGMFLKGVVRVSENC